MRLLRDWAAQGVGVVVVLHDLNLALRYADEVVVVGSGGVVQGPALSVLQPPLIERVWATPCQRVAASDGTVQYLFG
jgi:iron complex transport system ATP-binding protein